MIVDTYIELQIIPTFSYLHESVGGADAWKVLDDEMKTK